MKTNQNGFAVMAVALMVAVAVLAGAGFFVYQAQIAKPNPAPVSAPATQKTENLSNQSEESEKEVQTAETVASSTEPIDTSEWKTYRNEEYGFEFIYPEWSNLQEVDSNRLRGGDKLLEKAFELDGVGIISVYGNPSNLGIKAWLAENKENFKDQGCGLVAEDCPEDWCKAKSITIDDNFALRGDIGCCCGFWMDSAAVASRNRVFFIETTGSVEVDQVYEKMLANFKFVESAGKTVNDCGEYLRKAEAELKTGELSESCGKIVDIGNGLKWKYIPVEYEDDWLNYPYTGSILAFWDGSGKFIQKINETIENVRYINVNFDDDINFDGYKDLKIMVNSGPGAGFEAVSYDYWIFNPVIGKYEKNQILANIVNPNFDKDKKMIFSGVRLGNSCFADRTCVGGFDTIYKFANGFWQYAYDRGNLPKFEDFPAKKIYGGNSAKINFAKHPGAEEFEKTGGASGAYEGLIGGEVAKGPNFNDHYRIIKWSCGSSCVAAMIVDVATGEIIYSPFINDKNNRPDFSPWKNLDYRVDSSLLVVNGKYYSWMPWMSTEIYVDDLQ